MPAVFAECYNAKNGGNLVANLIFMIIVLKYFFLKLIILIPVLNVCFRVRVKKLCNKINYKSYLTLTLTFIQVLAPIKLKIGKIYYFITLLLLHLG